MSDYSPSNGQYRPAPRGLRGFTEVEQVAETEQAGLTQPAGYFVKTIDISGIISVKEVAAQGLPVRSWYEGYARQGSFSWFSVLPLEQTVYQPRRLTGPVQFLVKLLELWQLDDSGACALLGYDLQDKEAVQSILSGATGLRGRDARDRVASLVKIRTLLSALFRSIEKENEWLRAPKGPLDNRSPLDLMLEGSMEKLLTVRQFVEVTAGV
jgi:hypothetical protein